MPIDFHKELNQEQLDAVLHGDGPCLVLAGAGSGKTRTVTYRVAQLLERGVDPASILLLTFTNKAAREMLQRIGSLVALNAMPGPAANGIWGGTFHSVANRLLRTFAREVGYTPSFSILDEDDAKSLMKAVLKDAKIDPKARRFPSAAVLQHTYSYSRNTGLTIKEAIEDKCSNFMDCGNDMEFVLRMYQERKAQANAMDFDDMLWNWLRLMETRPDVANQISSRFRWVLVDEYQDTNALQARVVGCLGKTHGNVFVVGDDAQSIYSFRGADVKNILAFPNQWPGAKVFKLLSNYRSTPQILDVANASLKNNASQFEKELIGFKTGGAKPTVVSCPSAKSEAEFVADAMLALRHNGVALGNMAVLFRAASHSQALEFELMKRDIPFEYRGGVTFFMRAHIKDVVAYLRLVENPKDEAAWLRVLGLQPGIGAASASQILSGVRALPEPEDVWIDGAVAVPARAVAGWNEASSLLSRMRGDGGPGRMVRAVLAHEEYRQYLEREYPDWKDRVADLEQLAVFADGYPDAKSFLADVTLDDARFAKGSGHGTKDAGRATCDDERVVLSTIHQAKGLEWDTVFVIHLTNMGFPNPRALEDDGNLEEERRLFYVAVTRARNRLYLSYPQTMGYDAMSFCRPSMFLDEIPPYMTDRQAVVQPQSQSGWSNKSASRPVRPSDGWSEDGGGDWADGEATVSYDEPTINVGRNGERHTYEPKPSTSIWKKSTPTKDAPRISLLRDVDDL